MWSFCTTKPAECNKQERKQKPNVLFLDIRSTYVSRPIREPKLPSWQQKFAAGWRARIVLPMLEWGIGTNANYTYHELSNGTPTLNHNAQALETKALFGNLRLRFRTNWTAMTSFVNIILSRIQSKTDHSLCCLPIVRLTILTTIVTNQYVEPTGHIWQFLSEWLRKRR